MPFMAVTVLSDNGAFRNAFCDIYALPARSRGAVAWLPAPGTTGDPYGTHSARARRAARDSWASMAAFWQLQAALACVPDVAHASIDTWLGSQASIT